MTGSRAPGTSEQLINYVTDRPGHGLRYAIGRQQNKPGAWLVAFSYYFEEALAERSTGIFKTRNGCSM